MPSISVILPVYNGAESVPVDIPKIVSALKKTGWEFEVIAINDCSNDNSSEELSKQKAIRVITNSVNKGYSASIKEGIREARYEWVGICDVDSTYPGEDFDRLIKESAGMDMVVGARTGPSVKGPLLRRPARWMLTILANFLTGQKIPDINSGMRIFKKAKALEFFHLYPERFSFTTTITLAFLTNSYPIKYIPINYHKRKGSSGIRPKDFFGFMQIIFRVIMYFRPLKFFVWPGVLLMLFGIAWGIFQVTTNPEKGLGELPLVSIISGIQILFLGMLADLVVRSRR